MRRLKPCIAALLLLAWSASATADSWVPPHIKTYASPNRQVRVTVHPRPFTDALDYFTDKVCGREPAGAPRNAPPTARAVAEKKNGKGAWTRLWAGPLVNEVAPVSALVADDGRGFVTFDNWHMAGHGDRAVVIYGEQGRHVRSLALTDFLPEDYVRALPRSVSSIHWGGEHRLAGDRLILAVVVPSAGDPINRETVAVEIDLATGQPRAPSGPAWDSALAAAIRVGTADREAQALATERFKAPLLGPASADEAEWHHYLREAFYRTASDWRDGILSTTVLRPRSASDYAASEKWVREALAEKALEGDSRAFASPDPENLARIFADAARKVKPRALEGVRIYVAVGDSLRDLFAAAIAHSGAEFVQLDPTEPIPQRAERLAMREGREPAAEKEEICGGPGT